MECRVIGEHYETPYFHPRHRHPSSRNGPAMNSVDPAFTNGVWFFLRLVGVAQKNRPLAILSSNVQSIELLMDWLARRFWMMRQSNGCSTSAAGSSAAEQWIERTSSYDEEVRRLTLAASLKK